ncbi:MAG: hypothetical protein LBQ62_07875 [Candidatus Accumulibacter sp.]|nr:hypothetical protein [Accumulibacter sp.]
MAHGAETGFRFYRDKTSAALPGEILDDVTAVRAFIGKMVSETPNGRERAFSGRRMPHGPRHLPVTVKDALDGFFVFRAGLVPRFTREVSFHASNTRLPSLCR